MTSRVTVSTLAGVLSIFGVFAAGWAYWQTKPPAEVWVLDPRERILSDVLPGQDVRVDFRLKNTSGRSLQLLGGSAC